MPIRFLSAQDAQKIAAGEVVERPANILKELVENSIDARATYIEIAVEQGGKTVLKIVDNGTGMSPDDARICFERYATSKLSSFSDLPLVNTFGFRGEALASICSVAKVTLTTRTHDSSEATQLLIQEGKIVSQKSAAAPVGTTFLVEDLFYNIPARRKFLKATATEFNQITTLFKAFCFTYPHIHFMLYHDGNQVYNCPPVVTLKDRMGQLFEPVVFSSTYELVPFSSKEVSLTGIITTPHYSRYDRTGFYFFVNHRLIKNQQLGRAVMRGFSNVLPPNKYPIVILHLEVDPLTVDVNIHPKKEEVLFLHPHLVETGLTKAITSTLESYASQSLLASKDGKRNFAPNEFLFTPSQAVTSAPHLQPERAFRFSPPLPPLQPESSTAFAPAPETPPAPVKEENLPVQERSYRLIGQLDKTYLLLEHKDGLLLVDQHAAHERVIYERLESTFGKVETVELLFPIIIPLPSHEIELLTPYFECLKDHGVHVEQFGQGQLRVTALPVYAKQVPLHESFQEMLGWIKENNSQGAEQFLKLLSEKLRAQIACKAAVKAGDLMSQEAVEQLLRDLDKTERRFSCPHGRPTQWLLTSSEIERKFKRIS